MTTKLEAMRITPAALGQITFLETLEPLPLVDPTEAARFLGVRRHSLACYRNLDDGPAYYKFGRWIRYAWADLHSWRDGSHALFPLGDAKSDAIGLVDAAAAAAYLTVTCACLRNYRIEGLGPPFCRFGRRLHYPVGDLRRWAKRQRRPAGMRNRSTDSRTNGKTL